jgi:hypothetical protein
MQRSWGSSEDFTTFRNTQCGRMEMGNEVKEMPGTERGSGEG